MWSEVCVMWNGKYILWNGMCLEYVFCGMESVLCSIWWNGMSCLVNTCQVLVLIHTLQRSVVEVNWRDTKKKNIYRAGHKGMVSAAESTIHIKATGRNVCYGGV